jgi:hypothetical protein
LQAFSVTGAGSVNGARFSAGAGFRRWIIR